MVEESFGIIPLVREEKSFWVLLIHQKNGNFWGFPKGHLNEGETRKEAAARELFEEVGLEVFEYLDMPLIAQKYVYKKGAEQIEKKVEYFPAITSTECMINEDEVFAAKWMPLDEAEKMISYPEGKESMIELQRRLQSC